MPVVCSLQRAPLIRSARYIRLTRRASEFEIPIPPLRDLISPDVMGVFSAHSG